MGPPSRGYSFPGPLRGSTLRVDRDDLPCNKIGDGATKLGQPSCIANESEAAGSQNDSRVAGCPGPKLYGPDPIKKKLQRGNAPRVGARVTSSFIFTRTEVPGGYLNGPLTAPFPGYKYQPPFCQSTKRQDANSRRHAEIFLSLPLGRHPCPTLDLAPICDLCSRFEHSG